MEQGTAEPVGATGVQAEALDKQTWLCVPIDEPQLHSSCEPFMAWRTRDYGATVEVDTERRPAFLPSQYMDQPQLSYTAKHVVAIVPKNTTKSNQPSHQEETYTGKVS